MKAGCCNPPERSVAFATVQATEADRARTGPRIRDPMIDGTWVSAALKPKRIAVELSAAEYRVLEQACRGRCLTVPELVRLVALRLARVL